MRPLDDRLLLAARMYEPCDLGADIGTDHGLLPCYLLETGICQRMLLCDISPSALAHARAQVAARQLEKAAVPVCADGLFGVSEPCGCISITGMGGDTMARILTEGRDRLHGAVLVLSAHTEQEQVRRALKALRYHLVREEPCISAGRMYLVWRAEPGDGDWTEDTLRLGTPLLDAHPLAGAYYTWRRSHAEVRLDALCAAGKQESAEAAQLRHDLEWFDRRLDR